MSAIRKVAWWLEGHPAHVIHHEGYCLLEEYGVEPEELFVTPHLKAKAYDEWLVRVRDLLITLRLENLEGIEGGKYMSPELPGDGRNIPVPEAME